MAVTRVEKVTVADAWADNDGGVTVEVTSRRVALSIREARTLAASLLSAAKYASDWLTDEKIRDDVSRDEEAPQGEEDTE